MNINNQIRTINKRLENARLTLGVESELYQNLKVLVKTNINVNALIEKNGKLIISRSKTALKYVNQSSIDFLKKGLSKDRFNLVKQKKKVKEFAMKAEKKKGNTGYKFKKSDYKKYAVLMTNLHDMYSEALNFMYNHIEFNESKEQIAIARKKGKKSKETIEKTFNIYLELEKRLNENKVSDKEIEEQEIELPSFLKRGNSNEL